MTNYISFATNLFETPNTSPWYILETTLEKFPNLSPKQLLKLENHIDELFEDIDEYTDEDDDDD